MRTTRRLRARRGSALVLVLLMTLAVAALAVAAIFMSSSAGLLSRFYDRDRQMSLAADAGLELVLARLRSDPMLEIPDSAMAVLISGDQVIDAAGTPIPGATVRVYGRATGDTLPTALQTITLVARVADGRGTRVVRRMDLQRASFSRFQLFVNELPTGVSYGPAAVHGRVHSNGDWRIQNGSLFRDTVSAVGTIGGAASAYEGARLAGAPAVPYPAADETFPALAARGAAGGMSHAVVANGSRLEFVAFDADGDGTVETEEGFYRIFDMSINAPELFRVSPQIFQQGGTINNTWHSWDSHVIQNQCGAFYQRSGRWHFFPVAVHRADWVWAIINASGYPARPQVSQPTNTRQAVQNILALPTARCFPPGSPYLMNTERFTNFLGGVGSGGYGYGFLVGAHRYGGSDTTFTPVARTCTFRDDGSGCVGNIIFGIYNSASVVGSWRQLQGSAGTLSGVPATLRQAAELPYLGRYSTTYNSASQGVISFTGAPLAVSGEVAGAVTLRVPGRVTVIDQLRQHGGAPQPEQACAQQFGIVATGDILVADNLMTRLRRVGDAHSNAEWVSLGEASGLALQGAFMSAGGTVGVEGSDTRMGNSSGQRDCHDLNGSTNGGCLRLTGAAIMDTLSVVSTNVNQGNGFHLLPAPSACNAQTSRPPHFPGTNTYRVLRTIDLAPSRANNDAKVSALLTALRGRSLDQ